MDRVVDRHRSWANPENLPVAPISFQKRQDASPCP
jgi:hypothetical protein